MKIIPVPAFEDNYIWLISDGRYAAAVDPGDAEPGWIISAATACGWRPS